MKIFSCTLFLSLQLCDQWGIMALKRKKRRWILSMRCVGWQKELKLVAHKLGKSFFRWWMGCKLRCIVFCAHLATDPLLWIKRKIKRMTTAWDKANDFLLLMRMCTGTNPKFIALEKFPVCIIFGIIDKEKRYRDGSFSLTCYHSPDSSNQSLLLHCCLFHFSYH